MKILIGCSLLCVALYPVVPPACVLMILQLLHLLALKAPVGSCFSTDHRAKCRGGTSLWRLLKLNFFSVAEKFVFSARLLLKAAGRRLIVFFYSKTILCGKWEKWRPVFSTVSAAREVGACLLEE